MPFPSRGLALTAMNPGDVLPLPSPFIMGLLVGLSDRKVPLLSDARRSRMACFLDRTRYGESKRPPSGD